jgi:glycerophosphoryl diester phosphodiesterase
VKLLEKWLMAKTGDPRDCEDAIVFTADFAAVIDGATSMVDKKWDGKKSGQIAKELLAEAILEFPKRINIDEAIQLLTEKIASFYRREKMEETMRIHPEYRLTASLIIYSKFHHEIWMVGDCQAIVNQTVVTNTKEIDSVVANARAVFLQAELKAGTPLEQLLADDLGKKYVTPLIVKQAYFQNSTPDSPFSYGVIDGFTVNQNSVRQIRLQEDETAIVLASDGYPFLEPTLQESEEKLTVLLESDPLCISSYMSTKGLVTGNISFDDRAYLRFTSQKRAAD